MLKRFVVNKIKNRERETLMNEFSEKSLGQLLTNREALVAYLRGVNDTWNIVGSYVESTAKAIITMIEGQIDSIDKEIDSRQKPQSFIFDKEDGA